MIATLYDTACERPRTAGSRVWHDARGQYKYPNYGILGMPQGTRTLYTSWHFHSVELNLGTVCMWSDSVIYFSPTGTAALRRPSPEVPSAVAPRGDTLHLQYEVEALERAAPAS